MPTSSSDQKRTPATTRQGLLGTILQKWGDLGGERTATILSIVGTCVSHGIDPRAYLHLVVNLIVHGWPQAKLRELLPDRLAAAHPELLVRTPVAPEMHGAADPPGLPSTTLPV